MSIFKQFGFEKGLISFDGSCFIKKDVIKFYQENIDPQDLDRRIESIEKTVEKLKIIKAEYVSFFNITDNIK